MNRKIIVMLLLSVMTTNSMLASPKPSKPTQSYQSVISHFMESYKNTDSKALASIISSDAIYTSNRNEQVIKHSAQDVIKFMKGNAGTVQQDCNLDFIVLSKTNSLVMARVDIKYKTTGNQQNYLIIEKNNSGEWKITNIYKFHLPVDNEKGSTPKNPIV
jgi:ketosteroid isomerase-like protein